MWITLPAPSSVNMNAHIPATVPGSIHCHPRAPAPDELADISLVDILTGGSQLPHWLSFTFI